MSYETRRLDRAPETKTLRALIFDVDGTIADTLPQHERAILRALLDYGFSKLASLDFKPQLRQYSSQRIFGDLIMKYKLILPGAFRNEEDYKAACRELRDKIYRLKTDYYIQEIEHDIGGTIPDRKLLLRPGIGTLLKEAAGAHVPMAIASASNTEAVGKMVNQFGINGHFRTTVCHVPQSKPDPRTYVLAMQSCDVTKYEYHKCLAVEDTANGAVAALAAGMQVIVTRSSFSDMDNILPLAEKGVSRNDLRTLRGSLLEEDVTVLERLEAPAGARRIALVLDSLEDYHETLRAHFKDETHDPQHEPPSTSLLGALDDIVAGLVSRYAR